MLGYALRRLLLTVPVLLGITVIVFLVISLIPGDPATALLGSFATPENVERINRELGLDQPLPVQYVTWLTGVLEGNLGRFAPRDVVENCAGGHRHALLLAATDTAFNVHRFSALRPENRL